MILSWIIIILLFGLMFRFLGLLFKLFGKLLGLVLGALGYAFLGMLAVSLLGIRSESVPFLVLIAIGALIVSLLRG